MNMVAHRYTLEECIEHIRIVKEELNADTEPLLMVVTMENMKSGSGKDIRDYFAKPENARINKANAFIVGSSLAKIVINLYLKFSKPSYPTKIFKDKKEAISWLKTIE